MTEVGGRAGQGSGYNGQGDLTGKDLYGACQRHLGICPLTHGLDTKCVLCPVNFEIRHAKRPSVKISFRRYYTFCPFLKRFTVHISIVTAARNPAGIKSVDLCLTHVPKLFDNRFLFGWLVFMGYLLMSHRM